MTWWTHAINGLHENDFIMAANSDLIVKKTSGLTREDILSAVDTRQENFINPQTLPALNDYRKNDAIWQIIRCNVNI